MDFATAIKSLRSPDTHLHISAVANLLFLFSKAYRHLPSSMNFDPFSFTEIPEDSSSNNNDEENSKISVANNLLDTANNNNTFGGGTSNNNNNTITFAEVEALTPELKNILRNWPAASRDHAIHRRAYNESSHGSGGRHHRSKNSNNNAASSSSSSGAGVGNSAGGSVTAAALHFIPIIEAAQEWQTKFYSSSNTTNKNKNKNDDDENPEETARDKAIEHTVTAISSNPGVVLQTVLSVSYLPHLSRDICRAILCLVKLIPASSVAQQQNISSSAAAKSGNSNFWANNLISLADTLFQKRATLTTAASIQTAETLLKETCVRGLLDVSSFSSEKKEEEESQSVKNEKLLVSAWIHLLTVWASLVFDSSQHRTHKYRTSVGSLASQDAQNGARRRCRLFSHTVRRVIQQCLTSNDCSSSSTPNFVVDEALKEFVFKFSTNDTKIFDQVDETLTSTSIPARTRAYARGRFAVASAIITYENNNNNSNNNNSSPSSEIPFGYLSLLVDTHPGLVTEVWPNISSENISSSSSSEKKNNNNNVSSFCSPSIVSDLVEFITNKIRLLRTNAVMIKDLMLLSHLGVDPTTFSQEFRNQNKIEFDEDEKEEKKKKEVIQWENLLDAFISNSSNISPHICDTVVAPAFAAWWKCLDGKYRTVYDFIALAKSISTFFTSKCNSGNEKANLFVFMAAIIRSENNNNCDDNRNSSESLLVKALKEDEGTAAFVNCFRSVLASPSPVLVNASWSAFGQFPSFFQNSADIAPFLKPLSSSSISAAQKRACLSLADASIGASFSTLHKSLLSEVEDDIVISLPDAYLTLAFPDSAASEKLVDEEDDSTPTVKSWASSPDTIFSLIQSLIPGDSGFDPASPTVGSPTISSPTSSANSNLSNSRQKRIEESSNHLTRAVVSRAVEIARRLAEEMLICGPLISMLCAKRGYIRELAARAILGSDYITGRLVSRKVAAAEKKNENKKSSSSSNNANANASAASASSDSSETNVVGGKQPSLLESAPRALNAWKYLSTELLPFFEKRLVEAATAGTIFASSGASSSVSASVGGDDDEGTSAALVFSQAAQSSSLPNASITPETTVTSAARPTEAVTILARGVIAHLAVTDASEVLAAILTACSHSAIVGSIDTMYEIPSNRLVGRYRPDTVSPSLRAARRIFGEPFGACSANASDVVASRTAAGRRTVTNRFAQQLEENCLGVAQTLCNNMAAGSVSTTTTTKTKTSSSSASSNASSFSNEAKRSASRAFALLQAYLDKEHQNVTTSTALHTLLNDTISKFDSDSSDSSLDPYSRAALQEDSTSSFIKIVDAELFKKGILKNHGDRPPKGVKQDDWEDQNRREDKKANIARDEKINNIREKNLASVLTRVTGLLVPFATIRHLAGLRQLVSLESISALLPFLMNIAHTQQSAKNCGGEHNALLRANNNNGNSNNNNEGTKYTSTVEFDTLPLVAECAEDGACALLRCTPLAPTASSMVRVYRLLSTEDFFSAGDVAEANAFAHALRLSVTSMLPPQLVPPLLLIAKRFFRVFKRKSAKRPSDKAQHQLLSVLATCFGDRNISGKRDALEMLFTIVENYFGLHRMAVNSIVGLSGHLGVSEVAPLSEAVLTGSDLGREAAVNGLDRFAKQLGLDSRIGGILAASSCYDEKRSVAAAANNLVTALKFECDLGDWPLISDLLQRLYWSSRGVKLLSSYALQVAKTSPTVVTEWLPTILQMPKEAGIVCIDRFAPLLDDSCAIQSLEYLLTVIENSSSDVATIRCASNAGSHIMGKCSDSTIPDIISKIQPRLKKSTSGVAAHRELHNAASIQLLTALATRTNNAAELQTVIDEVVAMCAASQTAYVHRTACDCVQTLARTPVLRRGEKIVEIGQKALTSMMSATVYAKKKGHAFIFCGIASGAGLLYLRKVDFLQVIQSAARDRQQQRIAAMILLETCCEVIGEIFEPYAIALTPLLIDGIAEKDEKISECADDAAKAFMKSLSDAGLHQLIPRLIEALSAEGATSKKRAPALNLIGYTAFCSPKQLVATLPSIMSHVIDALCDANGAISKAAYHALRRVAGVVSNNEIKEHVEILMEAMRNPATETENALDALLYTRFFTRVDPASLAIISPVLLRGLSETSSEIRGKAAQIVGSLVRLVSEPQSLEAYSDDFLKRLQTVVQDPSPGVRATSAKAMASIAVMVSDDKVLSIIAWALQMLGRGATSSAERSGAAEALCEAISKGGPPRFAALHDEIDKGLLSESSSAREGFVNVIVYTPSAFPESMFSPLLPTLFNWVLRGLGDSVEAVRNMALAAGDTMITGYGKRTLNIVLGPLVEGIASENSSRRQATLLLTSKLIVRLVQDARLSFKMKNKADDTSSESESESDDDEGNTEVGASKKERRQAKQEKKSAKKKAAAAGGEDNNNGGDGEDEDEENQQANVAVSAREAERGLGGFSVLNSLKETIGEERFIRILAALHMARFEHNANVRAEVHTAWTIGVSSIRSAVTLCLDGLVDLCVCFASSDNPECNDLAERILEFTCQRLHETLDVFILKFSKEYEVDDLRHKIGALASLAEVIPCTDSDRINRMGPHLVSCVLDGLQHENERVRMCAGAVFDRVSKISGSKWIDKMVEQQIGVSVVGVVELVRVRPVSSLASVFKVFATKDENEITPHDVRLLRGLIDIEDTRNDLVKHYDKIASMLLAAERRNISEAAPTMSIFAESLVYEYAAAPVQDIARALKTPESRAGAIRSASAFFMGMRAKYTDVLEQVVRMIVHNICDIMPEVREAAARALQQSISCLDSKAAQTFTSEEKADPLLAKGASGRYALVFLEALQSSLTAIVQATLNPGEKVFEPFSNPLVFDCLFQQYFLKYVDHGKAPQKVLALEGLLHLLSHAKPEQVIPSLVNVGGKCVRFLTSKQEGTVISATMNLVAFLMTINGGGKEIVFENTLAASLCATMLCDSSEAKIMANTVALRLIKKQNNNAEKLLGGISARKSSIETDVHKSSLCRFIAIVLRAAQLERKAMAIPAIFNLVKGYFETPDNVSVAAAAGSCLGLMMMNVSVSDADVASIVEKSLTAAKGRSTTAVAGIACIATILMTPKSFVRVQSVASDIFNGNVDSTIQFAVENCSADRTVAAWTLRIAGGAFLSGRGASSVLATKKTSDAIIKVATSIHRSDDMLHSCLEFVVSSLPAEEKDSKFGSLLCSKYYAKSRLSEDIGYYDCNLEDENGTDTKYF